MVMHVALVAVWLLAVETIPQHPPWWPFVQSILIKPHRPLFLQFLEQPKGLKHDDRAGRTESVSD